MRLSKLLVCGSAAVTILCASGTANAATVFVGSWTVDEGPSWSLTPVAYSGQQAAALLFGGDPLDYVISTIDDVVANIDHLAWVSTYGGACGGIFPCGTKAAEDFVNSTGGLYASIWDTSAYVEDWAIGTAYRNYAFRVDGAVPEPATWLMMILGFGAIGGMMRSRKQSVTVRYV